MKRTGSEVSEPEPNITNGKDSAVMKLKPPRFSVLLSKAIGRELKGELSLNTKYNNLFEAYGA